MNIITGEKLQDLCDVQISKLEHKKFESNQNSIDIDNFNFKNFNNSELVYCNISLINDNCHALGSFYNGTDKYAVKYADLDTHI